MSEQDGQLTKAERDTQRLLELLIDRTSQGQPVWPHQQVRGARDRINLLLMIGIFVSVLGGVLAGATVPGTEVNFLGEAEETGSEGWFGIGLILAAAGAVVLTIGAVAKGVELALVAAKQPK